MHNLNKNVLILVFLLEGNRFRANLLFNDQLNDINIFNLF